MESFTDFSCNDLLLKGPKRAFYPGTYTFACQGRRILDIASFIASLDRKEEPKKESVTGIFTVTDTDTVKGPTPLKRKHFTDTVNGSPPLKRSR